MTTPDDTRDESAMSTAGPTQGADQPGSRLRGSLRREVTAVALQVRALRELLADWARSRRVPVELVEDIKLAVDEAMSNVVMHAYPADTSGPLILSATHEADTLTVEVRDAGQWRDGPSRPGGGRGVRLMRALARDVVISGSSIGTVVRLTWKTPSLAVADR